MTAILHPEREQWRLRRRETLGASEVAAVLGEDPRRGAAAIWASKVGDVDADETKAMRWGRLVESAIAEGYAEESERKVLDLGAYEIQRHPDVPWLSCTLDRLQDGGSELAPAPAEGEAPVEAKAVSGFKAHEWKDEPPTAYQIQLQIQMSCTRAQWGTLVALIGGLAIVWKDELRNDAFLAAAMPKLEEFWWHVEKRVPPPADAKPGTTAAIKALWANENGETVTLTHEDLALAEELERHRAAKRDAEAQVDLVSNQLRARLGSASFGALPDGSFVTLKETPRAGYTVAPTKYRALRRWWPKGISRRRS